jgi:phosphoenolpyruvate carboxykinase (GTP)
MRVLEWIIGRCSGSEGAVETPIGLLPQAQDLNLAGLNAPASRLDALLHVDIEGWIAEYESIGEYLASFGSRMPRALRDEHSRVTTLLAADTPEPLTAGSP